MVYIDCPVLFGNETGHWESDGLHMAKLGYQELGRRLAAPVAALVEAEVNGSGAMKGGGAAAAAVEANAGAAEADAETNTEAPTEPKADAADAAAAAAAAGDAHVPAVDLEKLGFVLDNCDCVFPPVADRPPAQTPFVAEGGERNYDVALVYLGNRKVAEDAASLRLLGCTHVVNAAPSQVASALAANEEAGGPEYLHLDLDDRVEAFDAAGTRAAFEKSAAFLEKAMESTSSVVYVHCAGGVSRSASVVLYWLITRRGLRLCAAWRTVKEAREVIGPNAAFMGLLLDAERELYGTETMARPMNDQQRCYTCLE
mmetsp:Transcript_17128/g.31060  ORF Transcript_17128/g.31060 Transcript_17128/m.31060 type:complete len:314 (+) Transcript_17128:621-1562(+)